MATAPLSLNMEYFNDPDTGKPVFNGAVYIGTKDLDPEIEANRVNVTVTQEDGTTVIISPSNQPLTTGANGRIQYPASNGKSVKIDVDGEYSIKVRNNLDKQVYYNPRANELDVSPTETGVNLLNGSFEIETVTGVSDNWTFAKFLNGSVAPDSTSQAHGLKSLKFISVDANGAGTSTSDKFNTAENTDIDITFTYKASNATTLNKIEFKFYSAAGAPISTVVAYTNGTTNPLTYTTYLRRITVPANGIEAELIITGLDPLGTTTIGNCNFDGISWDESNPVIESINVDNAVNRISISDAITAVNPSIIVSGEDVGLDIEGVTLKNGVVTGDVVTDIITADTANGDVALTRNGTGDITIDGAPAYGLVLLDVPEILVTGPASSAWTTVDSATLNTAQAKKAILIANVDTNATTATDLYGSLHLRNPDATGGIGLFLAVVARNGSNTATNLFIDGASEYIVNLDDNFDFDYWYATSTDGTLGSNLSEIILKGYYV